MANTETVVIGQLSGSLIECVKQSVESTFEMICGGELTYLGDGNRDSSECINGVIGIISLVGDVAWSLMVGLPKNTATSFGMKMMGFEVPFESEDMGDIVGELANVLAGDVSARLDGIGVKAALSLPTAARGSDLDLSTGKSPSVCMRFDSPDGEFWVKVAAAEPKNFKGVGS